MRETLVTQFSGFKSVSHRAMLASLWEAQKGACGICRKQMDSLRSIRDERNRNRPTVEHVVPTTLRGFDGRGNLLAAHFRCNNEKGSRWPTTDELDFLAEVNRIMRWDGQVGVAA